MKIKWCLVLNLKLYNLSVSSHWHFHPALLYLLYMLKNSIPITVEYFPTTKATLDWKLCLRYRMNWSLFLIEKMLTLKSNPIHPVLSWLFDFKVGLHNWLKVNGKVKYADIVVFSWKPSQIQPVFCLHFGWLLMLFGARWDHCIYVRG